MIWDIRKEVRLVDLGLLASTRVVLGAGLGLLVGEWLPTDQRKRIGLGLLAFGCLSTTPIARRLWCGD